ncbi:hypothetical protein BRC2024_PQPTKSFJ_CDS_0042 [Tegunavirus sp. BRC001]
MKFEDVKVGQVVNWYNNYEGTNFKNIVAFKNSTTGKILVYRIMQENNSPSRYTYLGAPIELFPSELSLDSQPDPRKVFQYFKFIVNDHQEKTIYETLGYNFDNIHNQPVPNEFPFYYAQVYDTWNYFYTKEEYDNILLPQFKLDGTNLVLDYDYGYVKCGTTLLKLSDVEK